MEKGKRNTIIMVGKINDRPKRRWEYNIKINFRETVCNIRH
jgi:hypothetical protein